jgi:DcuC family C4-dicarboxylate transporter
VVVFSLVVTVIIEMIRNRKFMSVIGATSKMFVGMGTSYAEMIALMSSASVFAGALQQIGGFDVISRGLMALTIPGFIMILLVCIMAILMTMAVGSSVPAGTTFSPMLTDVAAASAVTNEAVVLPFFMSTSFSRGFSPISPSNLFITKFMGIDIMQLIKRMAIPFIGGILTTLLVSLLALG